MAEGASNAGIARRIFVSEGTVEKHVRSILTKLDLPESGSTIGSWRSSSSSSALDGASSICSSTAGRSTTRSSGQRPDSARRRDVADAEGDGEENDHADLGHHGAHAAQHAGADLGVQETHVTHLERTGAGVQAAAVRPAGETRAVEGAPPAGDPEEEPCQVGTTGHTFMLHNLPGLPRAATASVDKL